MKYSQISSDPNSTEVTLWFLGWGFCDCIAPYIKDSGNVILFWDYTDLSADIDIGRWTSFRIKAWSMGVWAAEMFMLANPGLSVVHTLAYCGTPRPCDSLFGIGLDNVRLTVDNWSEVNSRKFARKIAIDASLAQTVLNLMNVRSLDSQRGELESISAQQSADTVPYLWSEAVISLRDRIFPVESQRRWWQSHAKQVDERDIPHWPF